MPKYPSGVYCISKQSSIRRRDSSFQTQHRPRLLGVENKELSQVVVYEALYVLDGAYQNKLGRRFGLAVLGPCP